MTQTMGAVPTSTGIGAPGTAPAPANLGRSPMASQPNAPAAAIPFTRGSTLATMRDATRSYVPGQSDQVQLQTNAFLENVVIDVNLTTSANAAAVTFAADAPWSLISSIKLDDPAGQSIIAPITGYQLYLLNKYLPDTDCFFDPKRDPNFYIVTGAVGTGGSFGFRLVLPVEHRRRDALGALNNSAANQRYLITINIAGSGATFTGTTFYGVSPTTGASTVSFQYYQQYWTSPPQVITTAQGQAQVQATPAGLGSVAFVRFERHNEVNGGGSPQIQMNNVGDYISSIVFVLRTTAAGSPRDTYLPPQPNNANWPTEFDWWVNDFQVHALSVYGPTGTGVATGIGGDWHRWMARFYGYTNTLTNAGSQQATTTVSGIQTFSNTVAPGVELPGALDNGVFVLFQMFALFDQAHNFDPANQYLPTDATTKLQIRGSTWGSTANFLEVLTRMIRPVSGQALFA